MNWPADDVDALRKASLFTELSDKQLQRILANTLCRKLGEGEILFSQRDSADRFFWLHSGVLKLYRLSPSGEEKIIEIVRPGNTFAEAIMFIGKMSHYPVSAQMIEAGEVWCFSVKTFVEILQDSVDTCFRLMGNMSQRLHRHINEIDRLTLQTATERVVSYLLQHKNGNNDEVHLQVSKQTLAAQLSIKPETLSRTFSRLSKDNSIRIEGNRIHLLSIPALKQRVEI